MSSTSSCESKLPRLATDRDVPDQAGERELANDRRRGRIVEIQAKQLRGVDGRGRDIASICEQTYAIQDLSVPKLDRELAQGNQRLRRLNSEGREDRVFASCKL